MTSDNWGTGYHKPEKTLADIEQQLQTIAEHLSQLTNDDSYYSGPLYGPRATLARIESKLVDLLQYARWIHAAIWIIGLILIFRV